MRVGINGCTIDLASLPLLSGVNDLFEAGIISSLHDQNRLAVTMLGDDPIYKSKSAVLFDPTNSSPQDKFINTIKQRIDKYYHLFD